MKTCKKHVVIQMKIYHHHHLHILDVLVILCLAKWGHMQGECNNTDGDHYRHHPYHCFVVDVVVSLCFAK